MKKTFEQPDIQVQSLVSDEIMFDLSSFFSVFTGDRAIDD